MAKDYKITNIMTIETKGNRGDSVYVLIGFEIKKALIDGVYFCDDSLQEKSIRYNASYLDSCGNTKYISMYEDEIFETPEQLLEALKRTIPCS